MKTILNFAPFEFEKLMAHLLPPRGRFEEAAFVFAKSSRTGEGLCLDTVESIALQPSDFVSQGPYFLELSDTIRSRVIKRAHELSCSLIEMHSHIGLAKAEFSSSDLAGFRDIVPHIWWRLNGRPYGAIVVAEDGFDALVWSENAHRPSQLDELNAGGKILKPTNRTIERVYDRFE